MFLKASLSRPRKKGLTAFLKGKTETEPIFFLNSRGMKTIKSTGGFSGKFSHGMSRQEAKSLLWQ